MKVSLGDSFLGIVLGLVALTFMYAPDTLGEALAEFMHAFESWHPTEEE